MIKDKQQLPPFKLSYTVLIIGVLILTIFYLMQWNSTNGLRGVNKALTKENEITNSTIKELSIKVKLDSLIVIEHKKTIDSLIVLDQKRVYELNKIKRKHEKLQADYNYSNTDDRWDLFTKLIDN